MLARMPWRYALIGLALLVLWPLSTASAYPLYSVSLKAEPHFNGHFKFGEWLPLRITLDNDGAPLHAEVRADTSQAGGQTTFVAPVELPSGAHKRLTLYVLPPSFAQAMRVRLMDGDRELASQSISLSVERNVAYLVGVIAPRTEAFASLSSLTLSASGDQPLPVKGGVPPSVVRSVKILPMPLADIPERAEGLRALDALVISGVDTSELSLDQKRALQAWVAQGGRLVLGAGASAARTLAGLPDELVKDWRAADSAELTSLTALSAFAGQDVRVPGPFVVASANAGRALIQQDGRVLLNEKRVGDGYVDYAALDLAASPFDAWAGTARFWEKLLTPGSAYPFGAPTDVAPHSMRANQLSYALQNLPALELPSVNDLAALLLVYIVLVGPINYLALRRTNKLAWGWLTIPLLTALFTVGAFAMGFSVRGSDVIVNKLSLITVGAQGSGLVQSFVGVFSPERTSYTVNVPSNVLIAPLMQEGNPFGKGGPFIASASELVQGDPAQARGVQVQQWSMQGFQTESPLPNDWRVESSIIDDGGHLQGSLVNRMGDAIEDAVLVQGNRMARIGDLPRGQVLFLDHTWQTSTRGSFPYSLIESAFRNAGPTGPSRDAQIKQQVLSSFFQSIGGPPQPPSKPTLIGWMHSSPLSVQVAGVRAAAQEMSLVVATLDVQYARGAVHLAPGTLTPRLLESSGQVGMCGAANQLFMGPSSSITLEYQLPDDLIGMSVTHFTVHSAGLSGFTAELRSRNGEWIKLEPPNVRYELSDPQRFISDDGRIRLRATSTANVQQSCSNLDVELEGNH